MYPRYHTYANAIDAVSLSASGTAWTVARFSASSGAQLWSTPLDPVFITVPNALLGLPTGDLLIYVPSYGDANSSYATLLSGSNGATLWKVPLTIPGLAADEWLDVNPIALSNLVIASVLTSTQGVLTALNAGNGQQVWQAPYVCSSKQVYQAAATYNGTQVLAVVCSLNVSVISLSDLGSGRAVFQQSIPYAVIGMLSVGGQLVLSLVSAQIRQIAILDLASGGLATVLSVNAPADFALDAIDNQGRIFYIAFDGTPTGPAVASVLDAC